MSYTCEQIIPAMASVTEHLVDEVAKAMPEQFIVNGETQLYKVLHFLGMDTRTAKGDGEGYYDGGVRFHADQIVRDTNNPHRTYVCGVYKGLVRKVKAGERKVFDKSKEVWVMKPILQLHKMADVYEKFGTMQAQNLSNYVAEEDFKNILEVQKD